MPHLYASIEQGFWERVCREKRAGEYASLPAPVAADACRLSLLEYTRPGWTFHAKGVWYTDPIDAATLQDASACLPSLTVLGSANLGARCVRWSTPWLTTHACRQALTGA